jgi:hypothetical protein
VRRKTSPEFEEMSPEFERMLQTFRVSAKDVKFNEQKPDQYGGVRYQIRSERNGVEEQLKLPPAFLKLSRVHVEEGYVFLYPEKEGDVDFKNLRAAVDQVTDIVRNEIRADSYTGLIKDDRRSGITVKLVKIKDKILSNFYDESGERMEIDDERLSPDFNKVIYPVIVVDSVYVSASKVASIQLKLSECVCFCSKKETSLDVSVIVKMREMKLSGKLNE